MVGEGDLKVQPGVARREQGAEMGAEMNDDDLKRLFDLVGGVREDFAEFKGELRREVKALRDDLARIVGQQDGLVAKVERLDSRTGQLEAWVREKEAMILQADQILSERDRARQQTRRDAIARAGWVVAIVGILATATEWFINNFRIVR